MVDEETQSGALTGWLGTTGFAKVTGFASIGAKRVILSWNTPNETLTLTEVNEYEKVLSTIFSKKLDAIKRVSFLPGRYMIKTDDGQYFITARSLNVQNPVAHDALATLDQATGSVIATYSDAKSEVASLQALLKNKAVIHMSAETKLKVTIVITVIAVIAAAIGIVFSFLSGVK